MGKKKKTEEEKDHDSDVEDQGKKKKKKDKKSKRSKSPDDIEQEQEEKAMLKESEPIVEKKAATPVEKKKRDSVKKTPVKPSSPAIKPSSPSQGEGPPLTSPKNSRRARARQGSILQPGYTNATIKHENLNPELSPADFLERCGLVTGLESVLCAYVEGGYIWNSPDSPLEFAARQIESFGGTFHKRMAQEDDFLTKVQNGQHGGRNQKLADRPLPWDKKKYNQHTPVHPKEGPKFH